MTGAVHLRPRPRSWWWPGAFFFLALAAAGSAHAQEPDTARVTVPDTAAQPVARDTAAAEMIPADPQGPGRAPAVQDTASDTLPPPPRLPPLPPVGGDGWARGVWEWSRGDLERQPDLSLLNLLERVPGVVAVRTDLANQPEAASVFGATAAAIRYVIDGFEIDPLVRPTIDPTRLSLLGVERVRVERGVTGITVYLWTLSPEDPKPRSIIEAGTGDLDINLFRGAFLAPRLLGGPVALGFERLAADGSAEDESSNATTGWVKWTWARERTGIQLEYRRSAMDRSGVGDPLDGTSTYWAVRARSARGPVTGEIHVGGAAIEDEGVDSTIVRESTPYAGGRLRAALGTPVWLEARTALRLRDHPRLPGTEVEAAVSLRPVARVALEGSVTEGWWEEDRRTGQWSARAVLGPVVGLTAFGELFGGEPLLGEGTSVLVPSPDSAAPLTAIREGVRLGAELRWGSLSVGGAAVRSTLDTLPGFGVGPEPAGLGAAGGEATGIEVMARLPTGWSPLRMEGWYVQMDAPEGWLYVPEEQWRAGFVYHHLPLPSGNLEIFARLEQSFRGSMLAAAPLSAVDEPGDEDADGEDPPAPQLAVPVGSYRTTNLELSIRVLTVRAFIRWQNLFHRLEQRDLPDFVLPGQNVLYGVKWEFLN